MKILFRVDGGKEIGYGHFVRSFAVAQELQKRGHDVYWASSQLEKELAEILWRTGIGVISIRGDIGGVQDRKDLLSIVNCYNNPDWVFLDGYSFAEEYLIPLYVSRSLVATMDDMGRLKSYFAHLVVHTNSATSLRGQENTHFLYGPSFVPLRSEFLGVPNLIHRSLHRHPRIARNLLLYMGSRDSEYTIRRIRDVLMPFGVKLNIREVSSFGDTQPWKLMTWADMAMSFGGSSVWELAYMGVPTIGVSRGEQEDVLLQNTSVRGITLNYGRADAIRSDLGYTIASLLLDKHHRKRMSDRGKRLIDGLGAKRIALAMEGYQKWLSTGQQSK